MEFKEALKEILKIKGISALEDQSTLKLLEDYGAFDEYSVFRSIMENIVAMKAGKMLQNTFYYSVEDKGQAWTQMKSKLIERLPYDEVFLNLFFDDLEYAFMGYAYEKGAFDRDINSDVEEMLGQVWTDNRGVKYSADKKRLINASEITGTYIVNPETEYIDSYAFQQNSKIERVILPKKLKKIGNHAFQVCPYLNRIEFQDGVSEIDECAFGGCALTEVYLPNGLHRISDALFSSCTNLLYVQIPKNVTSIGAHAFSDCHSLQYMVIPDNVSTIGDLAFRWCKSLYYVVLPAKLTSVGENIFDNCKSLKYIGIPKGAKSKFTLLMPQHADLFVEYEHTQINDKMEIIKKETLSFFQGKTNVIHCVMDNGQESYLSQSRSFDDEANAKGACKLNTVENEKKHVLFLFNSNNKEVGRYYLGKKLQGQTPDQIIGQIDRLCVFEAWNPETKSWVPCVGISADNSPKDIASKAISISNNRTNKVGVGDEELSLEVSDEDLANAWTDEFGVKYSKDKKHLLRAPKDMVDYQIKKGTIYIEDSAFSWCINLRSIEIPSSVVQLGSQCFGCCRSLMHINIPNSVEMIGAEAFIGCESLLDIEIPNSVKEIPERMFESCESLKTVRMLAPLSKIGDYAFLDCYSLEDIIIPESVTDIGTGAFTNCHSIEEIVLPDLIANINDSVFHGCSSLIHINIPNSVQEIGEEAFMWCKSLSNITLPKSVITIGEKTFYGCTNLHRIFIPRGSMTFFEEIIPAYKDMLIEEDNTVCNCTEVNEEDLKNAWTDDYGAKYSYDRKRLLKVPEDLILGKYTIIDGIQIICDEAFIKCKNISIVVIPNSVTTLGTRSFFGCSSLTNVEVPKSVITIGDYSFCACINLKQVTISNSVESIGICAFKDCISLNELKIPNSVTRIGNSAFSECRKLKKIYLPNSIIDFEGSKFLGCSSISQIIIPNGTKGKFEKLLPGYEDEIIEENELEQYSNEVNNEDLANAWIDEYGAKYSYDRKRLLKGPDISSYVIKTGTLVICDNAFSLKENLKEITIPDSVVQIGEYAFWCCKKLEKVSIPPSVVRIKKNTFQYCFALKDVILPQSVKYIESGAFSDCPNLHPLPRDIKINNNDIF